MPFHFKYTGSGLRWQLTTQTVFRRPPASSGPCRCRRGRPGRFARPAPPLFPALKTVSAIIIESGLRRKEVFGTAIGWNIRDEPVDDLVGVALLYLDSSGIERRTAPERDVVLVPTPCAHALNRKAVIAGHGAVAVGLGGPPRNGSSKTLACSDDGRFAVSGISSQVRPSRIRPARFFRTPPHCLKKKGIPASRHCACTLRTHPGRIGRAPKPLSPPTITHEVPFRSRVPRSSSRGSIERNSKRAGAACSCSIRGRPYLRFSTLAPHQMCDARAAGRRAVERSARRRAARFVRTWQVCQLASSKTAATCPT